MARRGRGRKDRPRKPNGRLRDLPPDRPSDAHLLAIGVNPEDRRIHSIVEARRIAVGAGPRNELASTPLGMLHVLGLIDERQYRAGILYEANQLRLGKGVPGPQHTRSALASFLADAGSTVYADIGDDNYAKQFYRCRWVEREIAARVTDWRLLDRIVVRQEMPSLVMLADRDHPDLVTLRADLTEVARFYERPPPVDASRHPNDRSAMIPKQLRAKLAAHG